MNEWITHYRRLLSHRGQLTISVPWRSLFHPSRRSTSACTSVRCEKTAFTGCERFIRRSHCTTSSRFRSSEGRELRFDAKIRECQKTRQIPVIALLTSRWERSKLVGEWWSRLKNNSQSREA